jgi:hypothetical protein
MSRQRPADGSVPQRVYLKAQKRKTSPLSTVRLFSTGRAGLSGAFGAISFCRSAGRIGFAARAAMA